MIKYVVLDFGGVIAKPVTGNWDITPRFLELIDFSLDDVSKFKEIRKKYGDILSEKILTFDQEENMFLRFYSGILKEMGYSNYEELSLDIAHNRVFDLEKYQLYNGVYDELVGLKDKYKLILLTDNWPCVIPYLRKHKLDELFEKVYVSSMYGVEKKDGVFFDYPIDDFSIGDGEALFIDDNEKNLDIAKKKGYNVLLMDRDNKNTDSKYDVINNLFCIDEYNKTSHI